MQETKGSVNDNKKLSEKSILSISISLLLISLCIVSAMNIYIGYKKKALAQKTMEQSILPTSEKKVQEPQLVKAYTLSVGKETFTLRSKEQVVQLLDKIKSDYDQEDEFTIILKEEDDKVGSYQAVIGRPTANQQSLAVVSVKKTPGETTKETEKEENEQRSMQFEEGIMIKEVEVAPKEITGFHDAYERVKSGQVDHQLYQVQEGDCLTDIAYKNEISVEEILAANPELKDVDTEVISPGQEIDLVTKRPLVDIVTFERNIYQEAILVEPEYIYNNGWYSDHEEIRAEGQDGLAQISANIIYKNGKEVDRKIIEEMVLTEAIPKVIEVGMMDPKVYLKPAGELEVSSGFGERWGRKHKGIDFACNVGTPVNASRSGVVVQAGWLDGYGYCVYINHDDGSQTRYAHLSEVLVENEAVVLQGAQIALSGNTGNSTGPHLHFEILEDGEQIDPSTYID